MHCPKCNEHYDTGKFCAECGVPLVEDAPPSAASGASINLGDANAISGGIHVDSHNTITSIVHERQKHVEEIRQQKVNQYKILCERVYEDGVMTSEEARQLEDLRLSLGLQLEEAEQIRMQVRQNRLRQSQGQLNPMARMTLQQIIQMAMRGKTDLLVRSFPKLEAMADRYSDDEVQLYYYLILAGLDPNKCIDKYETRKNDNYWQTFWTYLAYQNVEELDKAQLTLVDLEAWSDRPFGNMALLACAGSLYTYWEDVSQVDILEQARMYIEQGADGFSSELERLAQSLMLLAQNNDEVFCKYKDEFSFYYNHLLKGLMQKRQKVRLYSMIPKMPKIEPLSD